MLDELEDEEIVGAIERGQLDVGFVVLPVGDAPLETVELLRDPYVLIVAADSPLARTRPTLHQVAEQPLVGFRDSPAVAQVVAAFRAEGIEPHWAFRSNDNPTVQGLVGAGVGVAVMPRLTVNAADPQHRRRRARDRGAAADRRYRAAPRPLQLARRARVRADSAGGCATRP